MSALVRYDIMCRAIDAAFELDEIKAIHDEVAMLQAAARVANNDAAETRLYQIRMRAQRKPGELCGKIEKAQGTRTDKQTSPDDAEKFVGKAATLKSAGISTQQASQWERISEIPEAEFAEALATRSVHDRVRKSTVKIVALQAERDTREAARRQQKNIPT